MRIYNKTVGLFRTLDELLEEFRSGFAHISTLLADEVTMCAGSKVIGSGSFSGMIVLDNTNAFKLF
jgi:hypothetical protein